SGGTESGEDTKEPGMKVLKSALDGCRDSFLAADERRTKASTRVFADTGVMGLLCRHDQPLWLVNMTTPGERQFYVLALLQKLFDHLPLSMRVGLLYDIGCQFHRSCMKWDFLGKLLDRLIFGISVFHAYGHQWPCQLIYHPRKCSGFGLSDGEGCERFWSMIKLLIPSLRVSGSFQRIFALDVQISYLGVRSFDNMGAWLRKKWEACSRKRQEAEKMLQELPYTNDEYYAEWQAQVEYQTRPLRRVSKNAGKRAVEEILSLESLSATYIKEKDELDTRLMKGDSGALDELLAMREELSSKMQSLSESINKKKSALGLEGRKDLKRLTNSEFLRLKVNAHSLKDRLVANLQKRKFEMERLEKAIHIGTSTEHKLKTHVETQLRKKQPTIKNTIHRYNELCAQMERLVKGNRAPRGAVVPLQIDDHSVYQLDVDSPIWDNTCFDEDLSTVPRWMSDDGIRSGIKAVLQMDRCREEEARLKREIQNLQDWSIEQWSQICASLIAYSKCSYISLSLCLIISIAR
ncbi:hypothetical protein BKA70DRAFT_1106739, partial [Coprinopsis sp. MPI-PUGE-AT-0042]